MSTKAQSPLERALATVPAAFRTRIVKQYVDLKSAYAEGKYDSCGTRAGKLAESMVRYLQDHLTGTYVPFGKAMTNLPDACNKLANAPATFPDSMRIMIPRALSFVYTLRNKRGIAHISGDIDANQIDAAVCMRISDWCLSELIRIVHTLSIEEAQGLLDSIATRHVPQIWSVGGRKRVLVDGLSYKDQTLLLLYADYDQGTPIEDLHDWTKHPHLGNYKRDVLSPLDSDVMIEYDRDNQIAIISPLGIKDVEERLLRDSA